jgi:hypothetical protein
VDGDLKLTTRVSTVLLIVEISVAPIQFGYSVLNYQNTLNGTLDPVVKGALSRHHVAHSPLGTVVHHCTARLALPGLDGSCH